MAMDAPTPVLPAVAEASALASLSLRLVAVMATLPLLASTLAPLRTAASVTEPLAGLTMFKANEPATPVLPAAAPDLAVAA